jgi:hypothetical protein
MGGRGGACVLRLNQRWGASCHREVGAQHFSYYQCGMHNGRNADVCALRSHILPSTSAGTHRYTSRSVSPGAGRLGNTAVEPPPATPPPSESACAVGNSAAMAAAHKACPSPAAVAPASRAGRGSTTPRHHRHVCARRAIYSEQQAQTPQCGVESNGMCMKEARKEAANHGPRSNNKMHEQRRVTWGRAQQLTKHVPLARRACGGGVCAVAAAAAGGGNSGA